MLKEKIELELRTLVICKVKGLQGKWSNYNFSNSFSHCLCKRQIKNNCFFFSESYSRKFSWESRNLFTLKSHLLVWSKAWQKFRKKKIGKFFLPRAEINKLFLRVILTEFVWKHWKYLFGNVLYAFESISLGTQILTCVIKEC